MIPKFLKPLARPFYFYYLRLTSGPPPEEEGLTLYPRFVIPSDVVIEVGARIGGGTLLLSSLAKHIYSFEPNPHSFRFLKAFTKKKTSYARPFQDLRCVNRSRKYDIYYASRSLVYSPHAAVCSPGQD